MPLQYGSLVSALRITTFLCLISAVQPARGQWKEATVPGIFGPVVVSPASDTAITALSYNNTPTLALLEGSSNLVGFPQTDFEGASAIAVNPATDLIYIGGYFFGAPVSGPGVLVTDSAGTLIASIPLDDYGVAVALNPATNTIYVAEEFGELAIIDGATNTVIAELMIANRFDTVAVNPVTNRVYAVDSEAGHVNVVDGDTNTPLAVVSLGGGFLSPAQMAVNPVTNKIYIGGEVIDGATNAVSELDVSGGGNGIVVNPVTNQIYLGSGNGICIVDGMTGKGTGCFSTSAGVVQALAMDSVSNMVYVYQPGPPTRPSQYIPSVVTAVDGTTGKIAGKVAFGNDPQYLGLNPLTHKLYATHGNNEVVFPVLRTTVIDGRSGPILNVPAGTTPVAVAVNPVTNLVYTADNNTGTVLVTDGATNAPVTTVSVASHPVAVAVDPVTNKIYAASSGTGALTIIDGATNTTSSVAVGSGPQANFASQSVAVNPVTNKIYLANYATRSVTVVDGATHSTTTVRTGNGPYAIAVNPGTNTIYTANINNSTVTVINGATNATTTIGVGSGPIALAVDAALNKIYVANGGGSTVTVIDGATNSTSSVMVGLNPYAIAADPVSHTVYVADFGDNTVTVIDGLTLATTAVPVSSDPNSIAVNPATNMAYVSNTVGGSVTAIFGAITSASAVAGQGGKTYYAQRLQAPTAPGKSFPAPYAIAVNPATNKVYAADRNGGLVILDVDRSQPVPLNTVLAGVVDGQTVSTVNVFQTRNPSPSFTATVTSAFTSTAVYSSVKGAMNPPPSAVYYKVDGGSQWSLATESSAAGANPASFSIALNRLSVGPHMLYVVPAYGNEGGADSRGLLITSSDGPSPEVGNLTAYAFQIDPAL